MQSRRKDPRTPRSGGGLMHAQGPHAAKESRSGHTKMRKICWSPGLRPGPRWGSLERSPRPPSWWGGAPRGLCCPSPRTPLTIPVLSLCLCCVYVLCTHVYELWKCTVIFSWMLNTGPHSCIWVGGLQLSSAGTDYWYLILIWVWTCTLAVSRCAVTCRDTAGQEKYDTITQQYYRRAQVS